MPVAARCASWILHQHASEDVRPLADARAELFDGRGLQVEHVPLAAGQPLEIVDRPGVVVDAGRGEAGVQEAASVSARATEDVKGSELHGVPSVTGMSRRASSASACWRNSKNVPWCRMYRCQPEYLSLAKLYQRSSSKWSGRTIR